LVCLVHLNRRWNRIEFFDVGSIGQKRYLQTFEQIEILFNSGGSSDRKLPSSTIQAHRRNQTRQPVEVIPMKMCNKDRRQTAGAQTGSNDLCLRALAAVKQHPVSVASYRQTAYVATKRRFSGTGTERYDPHRDQQYHISRGQGSGSGVK